LAYAGDGYSFVMTKELSMAFSKYSFDRWSWDLGR